MEFGEKGSRVWNESHHPRICVCSISALLLYTYCLKNTNLGIILVYWKMVEVREVSGPAAEGVEVA